MVLQVQDALESKCLSVMERIRSYLRPERELNFGRCSVVRKLREPFLRRKRNSEAVGDGPWAGAPPTIMAKAVNVYREGRDNVH